jgi:hypothetical protein
MVVSDVPKNLALPYVKSYRDSTGMMRRYFRRRCHKSVPLPGVPGSAEFMRAYEAAIGEAAPPQGPRQGPGTVGALICEYLQSPAFANLKPSSQKVYRIVLDRFGKLHGHRMVHDMPRAKVAAYIGSVGVEAPSMANLTRSVLRKLLAHAIRVGYRTDNPVVEIDKYKGGTHHTWTDGELAAFEACWPLGTRERLAYALLLHTGQRVGDVARMRRADVSGGAIAVVQQKTGTALSVPIHPEDEGGTLERTQPDWCFQRAAHQGSGVVASHQASSPRRRPSERVCATRIAQGADASFGGSGCDGQRDFLDQWPPDVA